MAKFLDKHGLSTYESSIKERLNEKQDVLVSGDTIKTINNESLLGSGNITISAGGGTMTDMRVNGTSVVTDNVGNLVTESAYNSSTNKIATMADVPTIPTKTSDLTNDSGFITKSVNNLTNYELKTDTGNSIELSLNTTTYVMTLNLKNSAGTTISTDTIDLPLESVVVDGSYDSTNKKIVLELENGSTIDIPVADLINGLQTEITSSNKLSSDLVDDTNKTNKFVTAAEKTTWNNKSDFSGDYDDLTNKPTIPSEVTESTVSGWGFTKNTGTYSKPSGGIPKTDLASAVQTSLGKADTALQSYTETDPTVPSHVKSITQANITSWNNKSDFSGSYNDLTNKPTIPTATSDLTNDSGFITTESDPIFMGSPAANILTSDITHWNNKQDELVSGTNIKTINSQSIVGSGNVDFYGTELPIGTEVDYIGTTVPSGWVEIDDYSTSEIDTGKKWIDGKPIYRKCFTIGSVRAGGSATLGTISNIDTVLRLDGAGFYNDIWTSIPRVHPSILAIQQQVYVENDTVKIALGSSSAISNGVAIVEYTKTTD